MPDGQAVERNTGDVATALRRGHSVKTNATSRMPAQSAAGVFLRQAPGTPLRSYGDVWRAPRRVAGKARGGRIALPVVTTCKAAGRNAALLECHSCCVTGHWHP